MDEPAAAGTQPPGDTALADTSRRPAGAISAEAGPSVRVAAFYHFSAMRQLPELRRELLALASELGVRGTILLAEEGVNGTISGPEAGVRSLLTRLRQVPGLEPLEAKFSWAPQQAFQRLKVRLKREIVTMGCPTVKPAEQVGTYVPPEQWDALIRDPDTLVIDTRNAYEVAIGTFEGAIDPGTGSFREFPAWVERELRPLVAERQPRAIAMFCTGGIRCEKASAYLLQQGFERVHHLQGGILRYLEERPEQGSCWRGECFVFDQRVALNHRLEPGVHRLCHACGLPLAPADLQHPAYREGVSCHHCLARFSDADRARFAERQHQIARARARGEAHVGAVMPLRPDRAETAPRRRLPRENRSAMAEPVPAADTKAVGSPATVGSPVAVFSPPVVSGPTAVSGQTAVSGPAVAGPTAVTSAATAPWPPARASACAPRGDAVPPPILYSFRRCPYAIRARLALAAAGFRPGQDLELREVSLKTKPAELLAASARGTVPALLLPAGEARQPGEPASGLAEGGRQGQAIGRSPDQALAEPPGAVLAESLAIMLWALAQRDPHAWNQGWSAAERDTITALINENDGPFKRHLDHFKYAARDGEAGLREQPQHRLQALAILRSWDRRLQAGGWLLGERPSLADIALLPFVRQFRLADPQAFDAEPGLAALHSWLGRFLASDGLSVVMEAPWAPRSPWRSPLHLYHLALKAEWQAARSAGLYARSSRGRSLEQEGFIHLSQAHQLDGTAARFYADLPSGAVVVLTIDPERLRQAGLEVRLEPAPGSGELFPHLYGPLPLQAVLRAEPMMGLAPTSLLPP